LEPKADSVFVDDPKLNKEVDAYSSGLINLIYSRETNGQIYEILKSAPPEVSIPKATLLVNDVMEKKLQEKGQKPSLDVLLNSGILLIKELIDIGLAGGFFELEKEEVMPILQDTMQQYIEKGLKDGSIDPIELQQATEKIMPEDMKQQALQEGSRIGMPQQPGVGAAMEMYANERVKKASAGMGK
jgi:hypothetical protein